MDPGMLLSVVDLALLEPSIDDMDSVARALRDGGWRSTPVDSAGSVLDLQWEHEDGQGMSRVHTGASRSGAFIGLIANVATDTAAHLLLQQVTERIEARVVLGQLHHVETDPVWTTWSDGRRDVSLGLHAMAVQATHTIPPAVQFAVEVGRH
ncbi:hypothetical protein ACI79D_01395 [Geodermatophilus sp. SYSU D00708]